LILIIIIYFVFLQMSALERSNLEISGTLVSVEIEIVFETGGRVAEILVEEGDYVQAGDVLVRLEDQSLQGQLERAKAMVAQAEASYLLIQAQPLSEQRQVDIAKAHLELINAQIALQDLIEDANLDRALAEQRVEKLQRALEDLLDTADELALALKDVAKANKEVDEAQNRLDILTTPPSQTVIDQAQANLLLAEQTLIETREDLAWAEEKLQGNLGADIPKEVYISDYKSQFRQAVQLLETKLSRDQLAYQNAQEKYYDLLEPPDPVELALAEADLAMADAQLGQAQRDLERASGGPSQADVAILEAQISLALKDLEAHKDGPDPDDLSLAQARFQRSEAQLAMAQSNTIQEQQAIAQTQIDSAEAALHIIQVQMDKLVLTAPADGVIILRKVELGEVATPGAAALTLARVDELLLTIFLPESTYGFFAQGDEVHATVDSLPKKTFPARVKKIADPSEFIPRHANNSGNHQEYVYQVELAIHNPTGTLKPGMQVHVVGLPVR
jgi:multidrug resistance efflux pump